MSGQIMKALRLHQDRTFELTCEPIPEIAPDEALLRVRAVGVCASDVHYYKEGAIGDAVIRKPIILGHEAAGEVVTTGSAVTGLPAGARVAIEPSNPCGVCPVCKKGWGNICPHVKFFGTPPVDGCFREYVAWPAHLCLPIPDSLSLEEAAMTEPMAVGIYATDLAEMKGGETVAVLGAGAVGLSVMQAAKVAGASRIWVSEPVASRAEVARRLGATDVLSEDPAQAVEKIWEQTGGYGPDIVFECAGAHEAMQQAVRLSAYNGQLVAVGIPYPNEVVFTASVARRKNLTIKCVRRSRNAVDRAIQWAAEGRIDLRSYATHRFPLEHVQDAMDLAHEKRDGVIRAIIEL